MNINYYLRQNPTFRENKGQSGIFTVLNEPSLTQQVSFTCVSKKHKKKLYTSYARKGNRQLDVETFKWAEIDHYVTNSSPFVKTWKAAIKTKIIKSLLGTKRRRLQPIRKFPQSGRRLRRRVIMEMKRLNAKSVHCWKLCSFTGSFFRGLILLLHAFLSIIVIRRLCVSKKVRNNAKIMVIGEIVFY